MKGMLQIKTTKNIQKWRVKDYGIIANCRIIICLEGIQKRGKRMKRRFKKHNRGCNGKVVMISKDASGNKYQCNKCESETIKRKKTGG